MVPSSAAGYDVLVAGIDEASARSVLATMQDRLVRDPASALGIAATATPDEIRAAFLQLTKQYHPVRFGRMTLDIQRLSNEVFLALRAAHDALARAARRQSGPVPTLRATASQVLAPMKAGERPPVPPRAMTPATGVNALPPRAMTPATGVNVLPPRAMTPATGVNVLPPRPPGPPPPPRPPSPVRQTGAHQVLAPIDEAAAVDLLQRQHWDQARSMLHQLSARDPGSKRLRALLCYARGREAQLDRRVDDARVELQEALELDPDLQLAKTALTELFTRRK